MNLQNTTIVFVSERFMSIDLKDLRVTSITQSPGVHFTHITHSDDTNNH